MEETENSCPNLSNCPINGEWSPWSKSVECDSRCGEGVEIYTRTCMGQMYGGDPCLGESEEAKPCFKGDCYTLNQIELRGLQAEYPGTSNVWIITIKDSDGNDFCTTSSISSLFQDSSKIVLQGIDLGECITPQKQLSLMDFLSLDPLKLQIRTKEMQDYMTDVKQENKIKINRMQLLFCVLHCHDSVVQYLPTVYSDQFYKISDGFEISLELQDKRK